LTRRLGAGLQHTECIDLSSRVFECYRPIPSSDSRCAPSDNLAAIMFAEILTERLALRDLELNDAQRIFEYRSRPDISRFQSWGTESADAIRLYIRGLSETAPGRPGSWYQIGIILLSCGELIGDCGFQVLETEPRHAEVGIALAPEFQGRGYANETLRALLDYLLVGLDKDRVFGSVDPRNLRSMRMLERVGMRKGLVSRICGWSQVLEVVLACDRGRFPSLHRSETHTIFWSPLESYC
jgi:RimJ/RimL family protein N-acetyltransferase